MTSATKPQRSARQGAERAFFLPDFCGLPSVFAVVVLVELLTFVFTLAAAPHRDELWGVLALYSLFMQWAGLVSAALLCMARRPLARLSDAAAGVVSYLLLLLVIGLLSLAAFEVMELTGLPHTLTSRGEFLLHNLGIAAIVCALTLRYFYVSHQWRRRIRAEARARLEALQARIRPHFLFNSLNTISSLIHQRPDEAEEALLDLADLFRATLREEQQFIPLAEELALTRRYLNMESLRLGARLRLEWQLEEGAERLRLPPLILQPLVENAVYHGIEPRPEGGSITITIKREAGELRITVANPLPAPGAGHGGGSHIALENIRARLDAHYGGRATLALHEGEGRFEVQLALPAEGGA
ncbi:MAG: histidine kinase [Gammaproteobacteria bacterium]|nr:histidine kinase [Gammaproteobacteria bacterium]